MKSQRGLTLLEAIVVLSMMVALMVLVALFFVRAQRYTIASDTFGETQRQATTLLRRVSDELSRSTRKHLTLSADGSEAAFLSFAPVEPTSADSTDVEFDPNSGQILWKKWVGVYHDGANQRVCRIEEALSAPSTDLTTAPAPQPDFVRYRTFQARQIGSSVKELKVIPSLSGANVSVTTSREIPLSMLAETEKTVEIRVRMEVHLLD